MVKVRIHLYALKKMRNEDTIIDLNSPKYGQNVFDYVGHFFLIQAQFWNFNSNPKIV